MTVLIRSLESLRRGVCPFAAVTLPLPGGADIGGDCRDGASGRGSAINYDHRQAWVPASEVSSVSP